MTPCKKCNAIHLYSAPCVANKVVNTEEVVNIPVDNVVNEPLSNVVNTHSNVANKSKDRHKKTEARAKYMREYMKSRRAKISQKNLGENASS